MNTTRLTQSAATWWIALAAGILGWVLSGCDTSGQPKLGPSPAQAGQGPQGQSPNPAQTGRLGQPGQGGPAGPSGQPGQPNGSVSVHDLARRLGLTVTAASPLFAELSRTAAAGTGGTVEVTGAPGSSGARFGSPTESVGTAAATAVHVSITADQNGQPTGQVFLNGKRVGRVGGIVAIKGELFIPADTEAQLRQLLRPDVSGPSSSAPTRVTGRVVIDPGHGGNDPGTRSSGGVVEKNVNLSVAVAVAQYLRRRGVDVLLTRQNDTFIDLLDRAALANSWAADVFVSIHSDASKNLAAQGHNVIYPKSDPPAAVRLANLVSRDMVQAGSAVHSVRRDDRGLCVLKNTKCAAVLVELGFLSNDADAAKLADSVQQARLAWGIAEGIAQYLQRK